MADTAGIYTLDTAALTHPAPGRQLNEDRYLLDHPGESRVAVVDISRMVAVIDGVSAGGRGGLAAQTTLETLQSVLPDAWAFPLRPTLLEFKFLASNDLVEKTVGGKCAATVATRDGSAGATLLRAIGAGAGLVVDTADCFCSPVTG